MKNNNWVVKALGYYTKNTKTSTDIIPIIKNILDNNLQDVIILSVKELAIDIRKA